MMSFPDVVEMSEMSEQCGSDGSGGNIGARWNRNMVYDNGS